MASIPRQEYDDWVQARAEWLANRDKAYAGAAYDGGPVGKSFGATQDYPNQQAGNPGEMAPDAWFGDLTPDAYQAMASGPVGVPKTDVIEQELYKAATEPQSYTVRDTIPSQLQLSLLQAARKAHNGAKQRKQQLLTHAQMRAANRVEFEKDLEKLASGGNLTGID